MMEEFAAETEGRQGDLGLPSPGAHPEEMRGTITFKFGEAASVTASGRTTPAGLICAALAVLAMSVPFVLAARSRR